ncbi:MAG: hypothetical protein DRJ99_04170 [Thermoplasmata archaeon]|nr:MAG: hypothetical protein FE038_00750 [Thermoplasmata archaeon]MCD6108900.1 hypothetical protein [Thermoplasmata archaeon]RLF28721.1 MAG: hypothetical protein DRJ99_04170 [Thermoplasmata archaeon]RLF62767.1 MAG: hypothetical protein DRN16_00665 [Thermoplasmata archaeon]HDM25562.1 hypothetical protein [Thermoplasmatales archaeon]
MSLKKELLRQLDLDQLKKLIEEKNIEIRLSKIQKDFYANWDEKEKLVDILNDCENIRIADIEKYVPSFQNKI